MGKIIEVVHHGISLVIEVNENKLTHKEAWEPCGDGVWVYCKERGSLERVSIGSHSDINYNSQSFSPKNTYHKVVASSHPLWIWWGEGCTKLIWGVDNPHIALPKLTINNK